MPLTELDLGPGAGTGTLTELPPNEYDILSDQPPTWGEAARHLGTAAVSGALYGLTSPADLPGGLYNLGAYAVNKYTSGAAPYVSTPGERLQADIGIPQPQTPLEQVISGAVQLPVSSIYGALAPGARYASVLRQGPTNVVLGAGQGAMAALGVSPEAQLALTLGGTRLAQNRIPGLVTTASQNDQDLAAALRRENVPVNPVDLGPDTAKRTYDIMGKISGMAGAAGRFVGDQYKAWTDAVARRLGGPNAVTDEEGIFTPQLLRDATTRINGLYGQAAAAPDMPLAGGPNRLDARLTTIANEAATRGTPLSQPQQDVVNFINNLKSYAQLRGGALSASDVINELRTDSALSGRMRGDPTVAGYYQRIRSAIDDEFGDHLVRTAPNAYDAYNAARDSYRSLQTVSDALQAGRGKLTPDALAHVVASSPYERPDGELGTLASAGQRFIGVPPSVGPVGQAIVDKTKGTITSLRELGLAGIGLHELSDIAEQLPVVGKAGTMLGAALTYPYAWAQSRAARAMPVLGGNAPTVGQYYAKALSTPGLYVAPGRELQQDPNAPLLPGY